MVRRRNPKAVMQAHVPKNGGTWGFTQSAHHDLVIFKKNEGWNPSRCRFLWWRYFEMVICASPSCRNFLTYRGFPLSRDELLSGKYELWVVRDRSGQKEVSDELICFLLNRLSNFVFWWSEYDILSPHCISSHRLAGFQSAVPDSDCDRLHCWWQDLLQRRTAATSEQHHRARGPVTAMGYAWDGMML
jgi:hypothetical protein